MHCPNGCTELHVHPNSIDIFGYGTYLLYCPVCSKVCKSSDSGVYKNETFFFPPRQLSKREEMLIMRGFEVALQRERIAPAPTHRCTCPSCDEIFHVKERPITAHGVHVREDGVLVAYIYKKDGFDVCRCVTCKSLLYVFANDILGTEANKTAPIKIIRLGTTALTGGLYEHG